MYASLVNALALLQAYVASILKQNIFLWSEVSPKLKQQYHTLDTSKKRNQFLFYQLPKFEKLKSLHKKFTY